MTAEPASVSPAELWNDDLAVFGSLVGALDDTALCATANAGAAVSAPGRYARIGALGGPWPQHHAGEVVLRLCPSVLDAFALDEQERTLRVVNHHGDVVHRVALGGPAAVRRSRCGTTLGTSPWAAHGDAPCAAGALLDLNTQAHLDTLVHDAGVQRRRALEQLGGRNEVSALSAPLALHTLDHLHRDRLHVTLAVPTDGCVMAVGGAVTGLRGAADTLFVHLEGGTVRIDTSTVHEGWVVRPRHGSATLELYDRTGRCVLAIAQPGRREPVAAARWEHLTAMLSIS